MREPRIFFGLAATGAFGAFLWLHAPDPQLHGRTARQQAQIERGEYVVALADCNGCHTPFLFTAEGPVPDTARRLSGYPADAELPDLPEGLFSPDGWGGAWTSRGTAIAGEWGVGFPRNLTPDVETGLGGWTEDIFIEALRTGKDRGEGRDILPCMPWQAISLMADEDLKAIFAYLGSIKAINNPITDPISPTGERLETLRGGPAVQQRQADPQHQAVTAKLQTQVERGEYLVTVGDCDACHTPLIYTAEGPEFDMTRRLSGFPADQELLEVPEGFLGPDKWMAIWSSPGTAYAGIWGVSFPRNLTPDVETGLGSWTEDIFIQALRTGKDMGEGRDILPPMPWEQFAKLTDEDLKAIFAYLGSIEPIDNPVPDPISPTGERLETLRRGQE